MFREWFENGGNSFRLDIRIVLGTEIGHQDTPREIMFLRDAFFCFVSNHGEITVSTISRANRSRDGNLDGYDSRKERSEGRDKRIPLS